MAQDRMEPKRGRDPDQKKGILKNHQKEYVVKDDVKSKVMFFDPSRLLTRRKVLNGTVCTLQMIGMAELPSFAQSNMHYALRA